MQIFIYYMWYCSLCFKCMFTISSFLSIFIKEKMNHKASVALFTYHL